MAINENRFLVKESCLRVLLRMVAIVFIYSCFINSENRQNQKHYEHRYRCNDPIQGKKCVILWMLSG